MKRSTSNQNTGAGAHQKQIKLFFFSKDNYCKSTSDNYSLYPNQNLGLKIITWSISPDENNNIGLVSSHCLLRNHLGRTREESKRFVLGPDCWKDLLKTLIWSKFYIFAYTIIFVMLSSFKPCFFITFIFLIFFGALFSFFHSKMAALVKDNQSALSIISTKVPFSRDLTIPHRLFVLTSFRCDNAKVRHF